MEGAVEGSGGSVGNILGKGEGGVLGSPSASEGSPDGAFVLGVDDGLADSRPDGEILGFPLAVGRKDGPGLTLGMQIGICDIDGMPVGIISTWPSKNGHSSPSKDEQANPQMISISDESSFKTPSQDPPSPMFPMPKFPSSSVTVESSRTRTAPLLLVSATF